MSVTAIEDRDDDGAGRAEPHDGQEGDAGHGEAGQRDDHGAAGEDHGRARRSGGCRRRILVRRARPFSWRNRWTMKRA